MNTRRTLLEESEDIQIESEIRTWNEIMKRDNPEFYAEMVQLAEAYYAGGTKFQSVAKMRSFVIDKAAERGVNSKIGSESSFRRFIKEAANGTA